MLYLISKSISKQLLRTSPFDLALGKMAGSTNLQVDTRRGETRVNYRINYPALLTFASTYASPVNNSHTQLANDVTN